MKDFKKYYVIHGQPDEVYKALTLTSTIMLWSGEEADMTTEPGTEFSLFSGSIVGRNIAFEENRKIVQQWYFGDQPVESVVTLILHPHEKGTSVELRHTNIPDEDYEDMINGWNFNYFGALREFYEEE